MRGLSLNYNLLDDFESPWLTEGIFTHFIVYIELLIPLEQKPEDR